MEFVKLSAEIEQRYRRYLKTTFYFRDPDLRQSFDRALQAGTLSKGPYLEVTPAYHRGQEPKTLFPEIVGSAVDPKLLAAIDGDRLLYAHQEDAIRRVAAGRNIVVATGTGSGKTECFLYPILLHLYREHLSGTLATQQGIRALVLYPMNALAYDQRDRLGRLHARLEEYGADFRFRFGQYTGATPEQRNDSYRHAADVLTHRFPGELVLRDEMRARPPEILLTNFSMLEYQLLRPDDCPLFDGPHGRTWTFLVLDEAHQYRGTRGAEMSLLLRRLKQRLRRSGNKHTFRCIATSASLAGDKEDRKSVASFATTLFDEPFEADDVILARTENIPSAGPRRLPATSYSLLREAIDKEDPAVFGTLREFAGPDSHEPGSVAARVGRLLAKDPRTESLREYMATGPREVTDVADRVFPEVAPAARIDALSAFANILNRAEQPNSNGPFLSVRYHLFMRALEGAFIRYVPEAEITLTPQNNKQAGGLSFELALCRECGQHYLVGRKVNGFFAEAVRDPSRDDFGVSFFRPVSNDQEEGEAAPTHRNMSNLCVHCGTLWPVGTLPRCDHATHLLVEEQPPADQQADQLQQCATCGYRGQDPVREVIHGGDGPHAVVATGLFELIEQAPKKILAFADSRQEAAYFAWYLDDTYQSVLRRKVLYRSLLASWDREAEPLSLADLADGYRRRCAIENLVDEAATVGEQRRRAWVDVYREFLTEETRLSLAGVGLVQWMLRWPSSFEPPEILFKEPWLLERDDALRLCFLLLDQFRRDRAVELDTRDEVDLDWPSLDLFGLQRIVRLGPPGGQKHVVSWNGRQGWRVQFLAKILGQMGYERDRAIDVAETTLRSIWDHLARFSDTQSANGQLLKRVNNGRRLNPIWWRAIPIAEDRQIYRCDTCNRIEATAFQHICTRRSCSGRLVPVKGSILTDHHYRTLYQGDLRGRLVVEEHTAQLTTERGREVQRDFQEGRINVLSCSTTFELGVDLGDLNTVFLRNVPPEPFNYVQRVGRAGRRAGSPGFAVTYCRRGPHDLYHFTDPRRLLSGRTTPPSISLRNERVAERHLAAVVLSEFFRFVPARFKKIHDLVQDWSTPSFTNEVRRFLSTFREQLENDFRAIFPPQLVTPLGIDDSSWMSRLSGENSRLALAEVEVASDFRRADELEMRSRNAGQYQQADWAKRRKVTIADEDVLSFLSRKAIIPKYGFPVDVVELDTQRAGTRQGYEVTLARDLTIAIGEFAPTASLVAGKREWQSYGLKKVPEREWERKKYKVCHRHNLMIAWNEGETPPLLPCGDDVPERSYVIPKFGFVTSTKPPKAPTSRPTRLFTTRPYFLHAAGAERGEIHIAGERCPLATIRKAVPGRMAVLSEGRRARQFYICNGCGAGFVEPQATHKTPWNSECGGKLSRVSLGHEFVTDVVQVEFHLSPPPEDVAGDYSGLGLGIATALLEGMAEVVDVPGADLNVTIGRGGSAGLPVIVLYDAVPGGAGLVAQLEDAHIFRTSLEAAYRRVEGGCECGDDTSCYGCLRSYRNQFAHTQLKRGPVKRYIGSVLGNWKTAV